MKKSTCYDGNLKKYYFLGNEKYNTYQLVYQELIQEEVLIDFQFETKFVSVCLQWSHRSQRLRKVKFWIRIRNRPFKQLWGWVDKMSLKVGNNFKIVHEEEDSVKQASSLESKLKLF